MGLRESLCGMDGVLAHIDAHRDEYVRRLHELCRQPSIAAQGIGLEETAAKVAGMMEKAGICAEVITVEGGAPVVYGEAIGRGPRTLPTVLHLFGGGR